MDEEKNLYVLEDVIVYGEEKIVPPFQVEKLTKIFGTPRKEIIKYPDINYETTNYFWDKLGIEGIVSEKEKNISCIRVCVEQHDKSNMEQHFRGKLFI